MTRIIIAAVALALVAPVAAQASSSATPPPYVKAALVEGGYRYTGAKSVKAGTAYSSARKFSSTRARVRVAIEFRTAKGMREMQGFVAFAPQLVLESMVEGSEYEPPKYRWRYVGPRGEKIAPRTLLFTLEVRKVTP